ncbi:unnamed protein product, partial [Meganyctiphanes norvegica]
MGWIHKHCTIQRCSIKHIKSLLVIMITTCSLYAVYTNPNSTISKKQNIKSPPLDGAIKSDDEVLLRTLKKHYLYPPSSLPYNLTKDDGSNDGYFYQHRTFTSEMIDYYLQHLFGNQRGGFFIEAGALDGQFMSNSLWLEQHLGWTGLLIEADPYNFEFLEHKQRHAWISNTCISPDENPHVTTIESMQQLRKDVGGPWAFRARSKLFSSDSVNPEKFEQLTTRSFSQVQCFPLASYLFALNVSTVDFFSLDIQGHEWDVLKAILPFTQLKIKSIVVEHYIKDIVDNEEVQTKKIDYKFLEFMSRYNYSLIDIDEDQNYFFVLFSEKSLLDKGVK